MSLFLWKNHTRYFSSMWITVSVRYRTIELKLLAIVWAMKNCYLYLLGLQHFPLVVDHRPLVSILDKKSLDQIDNPWLQRLKSKIVQYNFSIEWVCSSTHKIPDAFSCALISQLPIEDQQAETAIENHVNLIIHQQFAVNALQTTILSQWHRIRQVKENSTRWQWI